MSEPAPRSCGFCGCVILLAMVGIGTCVTEFFRSPLMGLTAALAVYIVLGAVGRTLAEPFSSSRGSGNGTGDGAFRQEEGGGGFWQEAQGGAFRQDGQGGASGDLGLGDIRGLFYALGFISVRCGGTVSAQFRYAEDLMARLRLSSDFAMAARDFVSAGRVATPQAVAGMIRETCRHCTGAEARELFWDAAGIAFLDDILILREIRMLMDVGEWFGLDRGEVGLQLQETALRSGMEFDSATGSYRRYSRSSRSGSWDDSGTGQDDWWEDVFGGGPWSQGSRSGGGAGWDEPGRDDRGSGGDGRRHGEYSGGYSGGGREGTSGWESAGDRELRQAYQTLEVSPEASDGEVKKAYRRLISRYHPDRAIAQGMGPEGVARYTEITQTVQKAWETVKSRRGIS